MSPNITIEQVSNSLMLTESPRMTNSPSFSIDPDGKSTTIDNSPHLSAQDIFSGSNQLIKRPSTMLAGDGVTQMAQALSFTSGTNSNQSGVIRNRRQAIVPPKLATDPDSGDASDSETEPPVGHLIDVTDPLEAVEETNTVSKDAKARSDNSATRIVRRKRSGGDPIGRRSGSIDDPNSRKITMPTVQINDQRPETTKIVSGVRPDSQGSNFESIVSSGSATSL